MKFFLKNSIHKACKEIIHYYCCYNQGVWLDFQTFSQFSNQKKKNRLQITILDKTHRFLVFLRKMKRKQLRRNYQINKSFNIIILVLRFTSKLIISVQHPNHNLLEVHNLATQYLFLTGNDPATLQIRGVILWTPKISNFYLLPRCLQGGHTLGSWRLDSLCVCDFRWGMCVSPFFLFLFQESPPTIGFILGVIGLLGV